MQQACFFADWLRRKRDTHLSIRRVSVALLLAAAAVGIVSPAQSAQTSISGDVADVAGAPVAGAAVLLLAADGTAQRTTADAAGRFAFSMPPGASTLTATSHGRASAPLDIDLRTRPRAGVLHLILQASPKVAAEPAMDFSDVPNFSVAGVTDWTAVGGHGSDATLRTSEDLTRQTVVLHTAETDTPLNTATEARLAAALSAQPRSYATNHALGEFYLEGGRPAQAVPLLQTASALHGGTAHDEYDLALACNGLGDTVRAQQHVTASLAQQDTADAHRLAGEVEEKLGNPLASVRHLQRAAAADPSEQNYFSWGAELLLHRAIWQAVEVFQKGAALYPQSTRLYTGWGSALFAGARYDEASQRLCQASDLDPANRESYVLLGKAALAAPEPLPCAQSRLDRFVHLQSNDADALYFDAMLLLRDGAPADRARAPDMLRAAAALDPHLAEASLQLGILRAAQHLYGDAIAMYRQAIAADPHLAEAHYRLAVALDRSGRHDEAQQELRMHETLVKTQADGVEAQRRLVKQFLVTLTPGTSVVQP